MSVKLRFRRMGRRKAPVFGLVATDSRSPRDGRFIEDLGRYEPVAEPSTFRVDAERVIYWLGQGAQPSDTVRNLLQKEGVLLQWALTRQGKSADEIEAAVAEFRERQESKGAGTKKTNAERRAEALQAERAAAKEKAAEIAKERAEREAELQKQREEAEAAARAEAEEARAAAAAAAADSEALTTAADAPAASGDDTTATGDDAQAGGDSETPEAATSGEPVEQTSSQADAGTTGAGDATADEKAAAEAEGGDAAVAAASAEAVSDEAPDSAEEQPAATDATAAEVAADAAAALADQTEAGAQEADTVTEEPATTAPDTDGTAGEEPTSKTPEA